ncbi:hypothetical protein Goarm_001682, partial [Gossypium armourianum]|nr:hypothetical protein [Gossypium armourianum]
MYQSLCVTLGSLPKPTRVYCGHEYTVKNLQFASTVEPKNARIQQKLAWANGQRKAGLPTIPSTIEEEMETNPFMRVDLPELQIMPQAFVLVSRCSYAYSSSFGSIGCQSPVEALREIRQMKDNWRGWLGSCNQLNSNENWIMDEFGTNVPLFLVDECRVEVLHAIANLPLLLPLPGSVILGKENDPI